MPDFPGTIRTTGLLVTSLPASPADGQEVNFLADATAGIVWRLRYRAASASAYKWEFIGGPPIVSSTAVASGTGGGTWFTTPALTIPREGDYVLSFSCNAEATIATASLQVQWGVQLGDGTTQFGISYGASYFFVNGSGNPLTRILLSNPGMPSSAVGAGWVLKLRSTVVNFDFNSTFRMIAALPIRVK